MSDKSPSGHLASPAAHARHVDLVCTRFEVAWRNGPRPLIDDFLGDAGEPERTDLLRELILLDLDYRHSRGESCEAGPYQKQYPDLDPEWLAHALTARATECSRSPEDHGLPITHEAWSSRTPRALPRLLIEPGATSVPSRSFGDFELIREIARGGMGVVYEAIQISLKRHVALKMILAGEHADARQLARFRAEAQAVARLHHPHIVQIHEVGEHDGRPFLVLEYVEGASLAQRIAGKPQPAVPSAELVETLARAVHYAHQQGVVHRDLKPANVLVRGSVSESATIWPDAAPPHRSSLQVAVPKITDFGLAKCLDQEPGLTRSTAIMGTPSYMAPEQAAGDGTMVGPATDVYALGGILYEMLTGRPPFLGPTPIETAQLVLDEEPITPRSLRPQLPVDLETICLRCLHKEPGQRYTSAEALADDLRRFSIDRPILARPAGFSERSWRWCRRNPAAATLVASACIMLILAVAAAARLRIERNAAIVQQGRAEDAERKLLGQLELTRGAEREKSEQLWRSRLNEARAGRFSRRSGQRFNSLGALRDAARLRVTPELRNEAIACLALVDMAPIPTVADGRGGTRRLTGVRGLELYSRGQPDGSLSLIRYADEQESRRLDGPGGYWNLRFSPDARVLVSSTSANGQSGGCLFWNLRDDSPRPHVIGANAEWAAFRADSRRLAVVWTDSVGLFAIPSGRELKRLKAGPSARRAAFHPDGRRLAVAAGATITVVNTDDAKTDDGVIMADSPVWSLAWSADGRLLAAGTENHRVYVFEYQTHQLVSILDGHQNRVTRLVFTHDTNLLLSAGWDSRTCAWDPVNGSQLVRGSTPLVQLSPGEDGFSAHTVSHPAYASLWKFADGRECRTLHHGLVGTRTPWPEGFVHSADFTPDGRLLASAGSDGVRLWDAARAVEVAHLPVGWGSCARFRPRGEELLTLSSQGLIRWPVRSALPLDGPSIVTVGPPVKVMAVDWIEREARVAWSGDGAWFGFADWNHSRAVVFNAANPMKRFDIGPHARIRYISLSHDGRWTATSPWQGDAVKVWETATGKLVWEQRSNSPPAEFSSDGRWLVAGTDREYKFWHTGSWAPGLAVPTNLGVGGFALTRDGSIMAYNTSNSAPIIKLVETGTGNEIAELEAPEASPLMWLSFNSDGSQIVATTSHEIQLWDLRAIRRGLSQIGLDWDQPPYPSASEPTRVATIEVKVINP